MSHKMGGEPTLDQPAFNQPELPVTQNVVLDFKGKD